MRTATLTTICTIFFVIGLLLLTSDERMAQVCGFVLMLGAILSWKVIDDEDAYSGTEHTSIWTGSKETHND